MGYIGYAILFMLIPLGIMLLIVTAKVNNMKVKTNSTKNTNKTTQSMLQFKNISDNVIDLGNYDYRAIIEVSSINYDLKTDDEKNIIEINYNRFINSLTHPISIFILTKQIDQSKILDEIKVDYENMKKRYPTGYDNVIKIVDNYYNAMSKIDTYTNNNLIKKKYIIVPFNDLQDAINLNNNAKREESLKQIMNRCNVICSGIQGIGNITAKILNTDEILELLYSYYHREEAVREDAIRKSAFTTLIVNNPDLNVNKAETNVLLDAILCEAQYKIKNELIDSRKEESKDARNVNIALKTINNLRKKLDQINKGGA